MAPFGETCREGATYFCREKLFVGQGVIPATARSISFFAEDVWRGLLHTARQPVDEDVYGPGVLEEDYELPGEDFLLPLHIDDEATLSYAAGGGRRGRV